MKLKERLDQLTHLVEDASTWAEETEYFWISEKTKAVTLVDGSKEKISDLATNNFLLTAIDKKKLARNSWCYLNSQEDIRGQIRKQTGAYLFEGGEEALFHINGPEDLNGAVLPLDSSESIPGIEELRETGAEYHRELSSRWKDVRSNIYLETNSKDCVIVNSKGLKGAYGKSWFRTTAILQNKKTGEYTELRKQGKETTTDFIGRCEKALSEMHFNLGLSVIQRGASPVLLTPGVVAVLCLRIASFLRSGEDWHPKISKALPDTLELIDDPKITDGIRSVPFDDEGTPTQRKVLCRGPEKCGEISDLKSASLYKVQRSGNGFRRGTFFEHPVDLAPATLPTQLTLSPGTMLSKDIVRDESQLVIIDQIVIPYGQIYDTSPKQEQLCVSGRIYKSGKLVSYLSGQNRLGMSLISSIGNGGSHGSLLDRSAVILKDGAASDSGWFPHIFLPKLTW